MGCGQLILTKEGIAPLHKLFTESQIYSKESNVNLWLKSKGVENSP